MAQSLKIRKNQFLLNLHWLLCMKGSFQCWELSPLSDCELLTCRTLVCSSAEHSVADLKAEKFSKLLTCYLVSKVIVEHTVFKCHMGKSVLLKATSLCLKKSFINLLSRMFFAS